MIEYDNNLSLQLDEVQSLLEMHLSHALITLLMAWKMSLENQIFNDQNDTIKKDET